MIILNTYVKDIDTSEPLAGASVIMTDSQGKALPLNGVPIVGRKADMDGKFIFPIALDNAYITVSYVGYTPITHPADDYKNDIIYLKKKSNVYTGKEIFIKAKRYTKPNNRHNKPTKTKWVLFALLSAVVVVATITYFITKNKK